MTYAEIISEETSLKQEQIRSALTLFEEGATVPFIARYRKEKTGSLDETQLRQIEERYQYLKELEERKSTVLRTIQEQGKLTPELKATIESCRDKVKLEDLYLPYKPKRKTKATMARDAGLEPLARLIETQEKSEKSLEQLASEYVKPEEKVPDTAAAIQGALDILAEELAETPEVRGYVREDALKNGVLQSQARKEYEEKKKRSKFEMYYGFKEKASQLPSHRVLAMRRGEKENVLRVEMVLDDERLTSWLDQRILKPSSPFETEIKKMVRDSYQRLLKPAIETEVRLILKNRAEAEAFNVFSTNLERVLMAPPAGDKVVMGVDPGFRTGVKLAVVDKTGKHLENRTIYPVEPKKEVDASKTILLAMVESFNVDIIAIGNGTASREVDEFITESLKELEKPPLKLVVSEAGASVYSASPLAVKEFANLDVTIRSAISIARRVQDPLAELVKIDPKSIGVGQYQHDVNQTELKNHLEKVVESCVNRVGVNVNTASEPLLAYVSGVNRSLAKSIVDYREKNGAFSNRSSFVKVTLFGPKAFEQSAGFLRIHNGDNPLDGSAVHPERYELVKTICQDAGAEVKDIIGNKEKIQQVKPEKYVSDDVGLPTLHDILSELEKPSLDPRKEFSYAKFDAKVKEIKDLEPGMWLEGAITNVTAFGAFVDIGVHQDGLVHVSEVADRFVKDIKDEVEPGQIVKVRVLDVDKEQKRISLSMKQEGSETSAGKSKPKGGQKPRKPKRKHATVDQLVRKFEGKKKEKKSNTKLAYSIKSIMRAGR